MSRTVEVEQLPYVELARSAAHIARSLPATELTRFAALAQAEDPVQVELEFYTDDEGRSCVRGQACVDAVLACQRCLSDVPRRVRAEIDAVIVSDDSQASRHGLLAVVAGGRTITVSDLVEDELILGIPTRVCVDEPCENMPVMTYGENVRADEAGQPGPFDALKRLKDV